MKRVPEKLIVIYSKLMKSWNLLPSPGNVHDYIAHIQRKYANLDGNNIVELADLGKKLHNSTNQINSAVKFYRRKSDEVR